MGVKFTEKTYTDSHQSHLLRKDCLCSRKDDPMTLTELLNLLHTQGHIHPNRYKNFKTSIRYFAAALGKASPDHCLEDDFNIPEIEWKDKVDTYLGSWSEPPSHHTVRNTRNDIRFLLRTALDNAMLKRPLDLPCISLRRREHEQQAGRTSPYRARYLRTKDSLYGLNYKQWPDNIRESWDKYRTSRQLKTRATTLDVYENYLESYIGFLINILHLSIHWDDLFDLKLIEQYVHWHGKRYQTRLTRLADSVAQTLRIIARAIKHQHADAISHYCRELPTPEPLHEKQNHWFTFQELEAVALNDLKDARKPFTTRPTGALHPGLRRSLWYQRALILRMMIRIPMRQRNYREMQYKKNLYKDPAGHWHLSFRGKELKVDTRNGRLNTYHIDLTEYCPDILPQLEEFLTLYRPRIPHADTSPYVFLTQSGKPHTVNTLHRELSNMVLRRTNKRFYPHLMRTLWATECLSQTRDISTTAHILGDTEQMVFQRYHEILEKDHQHKARQFLANVLSPAKS
jgi:hypothetical protein